jgi:hypothetical protein
LRKPIFRDFVLSVAIELISELSYARSGGHKAVVKVLPFLGHAFHNIFLRCLGPFMSAQHGSWLIGSALPQERVRQLSQLLTKSGWEVLRPYGSLFLIATPTAHLAKTFSYKTPTGLKTVLLDVDSVREALYYTTGIQINSSSWMGIDKYCRFVLSIDEEKFKRVAALLERFVSYKDESS